MALPTQRARVLMWFAIGRKEWANVLNYEITGAFSGAFDIQAACASVDTYFRATWLTFLGTDTFYLGPDISVFNSGITQDASVFANAPGTSGDLSLPNEVAAIVRLQTAVGGKSGRGRVFVSGCALGYVADGIIGTSGVAALQAIATKIKGTLSIQSQSWVPSVYSKTLVAYNHIQTAVAEPLVGTQRRRRPRR